MKKLVPSAPVILFIVSLPRRAAFPKVEVEDPSGLFEIVPTKDREEEISFVQKSQ